MGTKGCLKMKEGEPLKWDNTVKWCSFTTQMQSKCNVVQYSVCYSFDSEPGSSNVSVFSLV